MDLWNLSPAELVAKLQMSSIPISANSDQDEQTLPNPATALSLPAVIEAVILCLGLHQSAYYSPVNTLWQSKCSGKLQAMRVKWSGEQGGPSRASSAIEHAHPEDACRALLSQCTG